MVVSYHDAMRTLLSFLLVLVACSSEAGIDIDGHVDCDDVLSVELDALAPLGGGPSARAAVVSAIPLLDTLRVEEHWYGHVSGVSGDREVVSATAAPEQDGRWYIDRYDICPGF